MIEGGCFVDHCVMKFLAHFVMLVVAIVLNVAKRLVEQALHMLKLHRVRLFVGLAKLKISKPINQ